MAIIGFMRRFIASEGRISVLHGSNQAVLEPDLSKCSNNGDFGKYSFYTTPNESLAVERAQKKSDFNNIGTSTVTKYLCDVGGLRILKFDEPDEDWLLAIIDGRSGLSPLNIDLVIAPIADGDNINYAIKRFLLARTKKEEGLGLFQRGIYSNEYKKLLKDEIKELLSDIRTVGNDMQYVFCSTKAIERLEAKEYKEYDNKKQVTKKRTLGREYLTTDEVKPEKFLIKKKAPSKKIVKKALYKTRGLTHER